MRRQITALPGAAERQFSANDIAGLGGRLWRKGCAQEVDD